LKQNFLKLYALPGFKFILTYLILCLIVVFSFEKGELELWLNQHNNKALDQLFKYWTYFGDGMLYAILGLIFLPIRYAWLLLTLAVIVIQTIIVQVPKRLLFSENPRPKMFFEGQELHFVDGVNIHSFNSMPSGHTATAFAIATLLMLLWPNRVLSWVFAITAILVAWSRVYLMQHFLYDTLVGAALGLISTLLAFSILQEKLSANAFQKGLLRR
jgi:membrane-associated phospholipid phosphatase